MIVHVMISVEDLSKIFVTGITSYRHYSKYVRAIELVDWDPSINYRIVYDDDF